MPDMTHRRDLGYRDEGLDLADPAFYADALAPEARVLPPVAFRSLRFSQLEDEAVWTRDWICIGAHEAIAGKGDLLPFTVGTHGIHVQRTDNGIVARFNKAQHGGCRAVPLQCQTGAKTKCSFTSCGYSRDRSAIPASELGDGTPAMHQYLGLRPERLLTTHVQSWGPLIFVNLDVTPSWPGDELALLGRMGGFFGNHKPAWSGEVWLEYAANWKLMGQALAAGAQAHTQSDLWMLADTTLSDGTSARVAWLFPNLVLIATKRSTAIVTLQPTAMGQTLCRLSTYGTDPLRDRLFWREEVRLRAEHGEAEHEVSAYWGTQHRPQTIGTPLPIQNDAPGAWMQSALAARVARMPRDDFAQPLYQNPRG
jgi:hypothetical protein